MAYGNLPVKQQLMHMLISQDPSVHRLSCGGGLCVPYICRSEAILLNQVTPFIPSYCVPVSERGKKRDVRLCVRAARQDERTAVFDKSLIL